MEDYVIYKVPSKAKMKKYRSEIGRQKRKEEEKTHYREFLGTWMVVVCPEGHFSAVPFASHFRCERCDKNFTVRLFYEKKIAPNPNQYWLKGNWRGMDGYWSEKNWKKAGVFKKGLSEEEARQLLQKLERGEAYDNG